MASIIQSIKGLFNDAQNLASDAQENISDATNKLTDTIESFEKDPVKEFNNLINCGKNVLSQGADEVGSAVSQALDAVSDSISNIFNNGEKDGIGLSTATSTIDFTNQSFGQKNELQRQQTAKNMINKLCEKEGLDPCNLKFDDLKGTQSEYDSKTNTIKLDRALLKSDQGPAMLNNIAKNMYKYKLDNTIESCEKYNNFTSGITDKELPEKLEKARMELTTNTGNQDFEALKEVNLSANEYGRRFMKTAGSFGIKEFKEQAEQTYKDYQNRIIDILKKSDNGKSIIENYKNTYEKMKEQYNERDTSNIIADKSYQISDNFNTLNLNTNKNGQMQGTIQSKDGQSMSFKIDNDKCEIIGINPSNKSNELNIQTLDKQFKTLSNVVGYHKEQTGRNINNLDISDKSLTNLDHWDKSIVTNVMKHSDNIRFDKDGAKFINNSIDPTFNKHLKDIDAAKTIKTAVQQAQQNGKISVNTKDLSKAMEQITGSNTFDLMNQELNQYSDKNEKMANIFNKAMNNYDMSNKTNEQLAMKFKDTFGNNLNNIAKSVIKESNQKDMLNTKNIDKQEKIQKKTKVKVNDMEK